MGTQANVGGRMEARLEPINQQYPLKTDHWRIVADTSSADTRSATVKIIDQAKLWYLRCDPRKRANIARHRYREAPAHGDPSVEMTPDSPRVDSTVPPFAGATAQLLADRCLKSGHGASSHHAYMVSRATNRRLASLAAGKSAWRLRRCR